VDQINFASGNMISEIEQQSVLQAYLDNLRNEASIVSYIS